MIDSKRTMNARGALAASRLLLSAIVMPADTGQERIDPAEIDRFSTMGLGQPETIHGLADAFCEMEHHRSTHQFLGAIDDVLAEILSPTLPVPSIGVDELERAHGAFSASDWSIMLDEDLVEGRSASREGLIDILDTLAHELRHAEQFYAAAKFEGSIRRIALYDFLPEAVKKRAKLDPIVEDSEEAAFGEFLLTADINDEVHEKKKYIDDAIDNPDISAEDYEYYVDVVNTKLPWERDATSIEGALRRTLEECLQPR